MSEKHERVVAALELREPDRVPTMDLISEFSTINKILGSKPSVASKLFANPRMGWLLDRVLPYTKNLDIADWEISRFAYHATAAMAELGYDSAWVNYLPVFRYLSSTRVEDIYGRYFDIAFDRVGNLSTPMYRGGLISSQEDWKAWDKRAILRLPERAYRTYKRIQKDFGDKIFIFGIFSFGLFENTWQPMGFERFVVALRKEKEFVRRVIRFHADLQCMGIEAMADAGLPGVLFGDDLAYRSGPILSPRTLEEFYGDAYRRITETAHRLGMKIIMHSCGNTSSLLEWFCDCGFDGVHPLEPTAGMDLASVKQAVGDRICLVGNIDITHILVDATREEVFEAVRQAIKDAGAGGGYILAPDHSHPDMSVERLRWMLEAVERYGRYPLNLEE